MNNQRGNYDNNHTYNEYTGQPKGAKKWVIALIISVTFLLAAAVIFVSIVVNKLDRNLPENAAESILTQEKKEDENNDVAVDDKSDVSDGVEEGEPIMKRLYDNHVAFIETVKKNLGIPDDAKVTYNISAPAYQDVIQEETVEVSFYQDGKVVACAECSTKTGALMRGIYNYTPPTDEKNEELTQKPEENKEDEETAEAPDITEVKYVPYTNTRYGFTLYVPDFLKVTAEADNGDGRKYESADKSVILIASGAHITVTEPTRDAYYDYILQKLDYTPTFQTKKPNGFVFSGIKDGKIIYDKCIVKSDGTENSFHIEYPQERKEDFDEIITQMAATFKSGVGEDSAVEN